jgi:hypothetical protein
LAGSVLVLLFSLIASAGAAAPVDSLRPVLAPWNAPEQFAEWQASIGGTASLACESVWPGDARLCFRVWEGKKRRWVTEEDLVVWGVGMDSLKTVLRSQAAERLTAMSVKSPIDMPGSYLELVDGDGWAASVVMLPDLVCDQLGNKRLLVAAPNESVVFAWTPGDVALDSAIGISVKSVFKQGNRPVTPVVYSWSGRGWVAYGEAKTRAP